MSQTIFVRRNTTRETFEVKINGETYVAEVSSSCLRGVFYIWNMLGEEITDEAIRKQFIEEYKKLETAPLTML